MNSADDVYSISIPEFDGGALSNLEDATGASWWVQPEGDRYRHRLDEPCLWIRYDMGRELDSGRALDGCFFTQVESSMWWASIRARFTAAGFLEDANELASGEWGCTPQWH